MAPHNPTTAALPPLHVVVVTGGEGPVTLDIDEPDVVVAADAGGAAADRLGLSPDVVIGDFDSIEDSLLARLDREGATVDRHDPNKDASDLELALNEAVRRGATTITVVGGGGGRLSHLLTNAAVVAAPAYRSVAVRWIMRDATVHILHAGTTLTLAGDPGDLVSLLAVGGDAGGVTAEGVRWELSDATLASGSSQGLSNILTSASGRFGVATGTLLVVHEEGEK